MLLLLCAMHFGAMTLGAQSRVPVRVPVRELTAVDARTSASFGNVFGVRHLANATLLVNDGVHRQLVLLDASLDHPVVVLDSVAVGGNSYGPRASPLIPYLADSSLFVDGASLTLLVIDPAGKVARVMSAPKPSDVRSLAGSASGTDPRGNLVYRGLLASFTVPATATTPAYTQWPDSAPIVRASFETRTVDTLARVRVQTIARYNFARDADGKIVRRATVAPVLTPDEWAVLSDGSIAIVRGRDYHVDWIDADGTRASTAPLPFDWRRITDGEKQGLVDSARKVVEAAMAASPSVSPSASASGAPAPSVSAPVLDMLPVPDYYPPIRDGAVKADLDGNLWILPATSAGSKSGALLYDVVSRKGGLMYRVRLPAGRSIAGFGRGGTVYLMAGDAAHGWSVERARVAGASRG
jgi:hypothetical protein